MVCYIYDMNIFQPTTVRASKKLRLISWTLGLLFVLSAVNFFLSTSPLTESEFYPSLLQTLFFSLLGGAMLLLAWGIVRYTRWVRTPLYVVFVSNALLFVYSTFMVLDWVEASSSLVVAILLFIYLKQSKSILTGRRWLGLQIFTILALLPGTLFILLTVVFPDERLLDDSSLQLDPAAVLAPEENLYVTVTDLGTELPGSAQEAKQLVDGYPAEWDQTEANRLLGTLAPQAAAYLAATEQQYQCPTSVNDFSMDADFCELNLLRDYAEVAQFAAITEARRGNSALAQEYAMAPIKVGKAMVESDNVSTIEYLAGLASMNIGLDTLAILEEQGVLGSAAIAQLLESATIPTETLRTPLQREYLGMRLTLEESLDIPQSYIYHPNRTRNEYYTFMSAAVQNGTRECVVTASDTQSAADQEMITYLEDQRAKAFNPARPNIIGNIFLTVVLSSLSGVQNNVCEINERVAEYAR